MGKLSSNLLLPRVKTLAYLFLFLNAINTISGAKYENEPNQGHTHEHDRLLKRQTGSFGFQHNNPSNNYYMSGNNNYDTLRSNNLNLNSNANYRDRDPYYPSSSSYPSGVGSVGIGRSNYYNRDDYRDYRDRDRDLPNRDRLRDPYYDDYRYNNNYQRDREAAAAQNQEYLMRNGQMRHAEYQKRIGQVGPAGQEYYDPFYFIGLRKNGESGQTLNSGLSGSSQGIGSTFPSPPSTNSGLGGGGLSPSVSTSVVPSTVSNSNLNTPASPSASSAPLRNRRNSHQRPNDFYNDVRGDKYDIMMAKSAYPPLNHNQHRNSNHHRWANHHLDQPFLTREQLVRQRPDSRVPYPTNHIDHHYGSSASGQPWSVRVGTQLKVNDDGRSPNPHRFYVRDEIHPNKSRSRYPNPIYRRK